MTVTLQLSVGLAMLLTLIHHDQTDKCHFRAAAKTKRETFCLLISVERELFSSSAVNLVAISFHLLRILGLDLGGQPMYRFSDIS